MNPSGEHSDTSAIDLEARLRARKDVMIRVAAALVGTADAEDAAREASLRAWRSRDALRDAEAFRSWPPRSIVNVCHDGLRGRRDDL
jgi:DNA-directed RNA polymerase specialized sigma24 family protein